jgi:SprT-like family
MIMIHDFGPSIATLQEKVDQQHDRPVTVQDLQKKYSQYNTKYFQNKLPSVTIQFANLQGETAGLTSFVSLTDEVGRTTIKPGSIRIDMNNMFKSPNVHYGKQGSADTILLHEMTHVLMGVLGLVKEQHGPQFRSWLQKLSAATGFAYDDLMGKQQATEWSDVNRLRELAGLHC